MPGVGSGTIVGGKGDCPDLSMASSRDQIRVDRPRWYKHGTINRGAAHIVTYRAG
jgi:hypothetical protein